MLNLQKRIPHMLNIINARDFNVPLARWTTCSTHVQCITRVSASVYVMLFQASSDGRTMVASFARVDQYAARSDILVVVRELIEDIVSNLLQCPRPIRSSWRVS